MYGYKLYENGRRQPLRQLRRRGPRALPDRRAAATRRCDVDRGHRAGHAALPVADVRRAARRVGRPRLDDPAVRPPGAARTSGTTAACACRARCAASATSATSRPTCASCAARAARAPRASATDFRSRRESLLAVDEAVEAVVGALARTGRLASTYVLFTSDNGFFQGEHRIQKGKYLAYDPSSHVPLLIRGPGIPPGTVSGELVDERRPRPDRPRGGGRRRRPADRRPLAAPVRARRALPHAAGRCCTRGSRRATSTATARRTGGTVGEYHAIRTARYLYIEWINGAIELYDRARDPERAALAPPRPPLPADPPLAAPRAGAPAHLHGRRLPPADAGSAAAVVSLRRCRSAGRPRALARRPRLPRRRLGADEPVRTSSAAPISAYPSPGTVSAGPRHADLAARRRPPTGIGRDHRDGLAQRPPRRPAARPLRRRGRELRAAAQPLRGGERVTVRTDLPVRGTRNGDFTFRTARIPSRVTIQNLILENIHAKKTRPFRSRPDLAPPFVTVDTARPGDRPRPPVPEPEVQARREAGRPADRRQPRRADLVPAAARASRPRPTSARRPTRASRC